MIRIYIGKSAAGKDYFLRKDVAAGFKPIILFTTRPMRTGEVDGKDYNFVPLTEFVQLQRGGALMEERSYEVNYNGKRDVWYYGTPWVEAKGDYVISVGIGAVLPFIHQYDAKDIEVILIEAPDDVREERARKRGSFSKTEWDRRLIADKEDFSVETISAIEKELRKKIVVINNGGKEKY